MPGCGRTEGASAGPDSRLPIREVVFRGSREPRIIFPDSPAGQRHSSRSKAGSYQAPFVYFGTSVGCGSLGRHLSLKTVFAYPCGPKIMEPSGTQYVGTQFRPQPSKRDFPSGRGDTTSGREQIGHKTSSRPSKTLSIVVRLMHYCERNQLHRARGFTPLRLW
jgi:hypothetical protein